MLLIHVRSVKIQLDRIVIEELAAKMSFNR